MVPKMCSLIYSIFYLFFIGFRDFRFATILVVFGRVERYLCNAYGFLLQLLHIGFYQSLFRLFYWCRGLLQGTFCKPVFGIFGTYNRFLPSDLFSCVNGLLWLAFALADRCRCSVLYYK